MEFLKRLIATVIGVFVALFLLFLFGLFILGIMVQQSSKTKETAANSVLYIDLAHVITEQTELNPFGDLDLTGGEKSIGLNDIVARIEAAKEDKNIKVSYLNPAVVNVGFTTLKAVRDALVDFKTSEKFIVAYSDV